MAGEAEAEPEDSRGFPRGGGGAGGIAPVSNPLHPHGLNVTVVNGNVDVAMRKLRRKVIAEGVKKKFQNNRVSTPCSLARGVHAGSLPRFDECTSL